MSLDGIIYKYIATNIKMKVDFQQKFMSCGHAGLYTHNSSFSTYSRPGFRVSSMHLLVALYLNLNIT